MAQPVGTLCYQAPEVILNKEYTFGVDWWGVGTMIFEMVTGKAPFGNDNSFSIQQRILSTILNELDGIDSAEGVVLVGATNRLDMIDAALLRPGRFDHVLQVPQPDAAGRAAILRLATRRIPLAADVDLTAVAHTASSRTGAEMTRVCKEAALAALREDRAATVVSARHFERALSLSPAG